MNKNSKTIVALDASNLDEALKLVETLAPRVAAFKIGMEFFTANGPEGAIKIIEKGGDVFLDLKYHDIPNTVSKAVAEATKLGVWMTNIHAGGGFEMIKAASESAKQTADKLGVRKPILLAVTVLTSLNDELLAQIGFANKAAEQVVILAKLAKDAGADGVVCSPNEAAAIRRECGADFIIVTPGVRPADADVADQKRVATPSMAVKNGANYLVVGRPITGAADPAAAADAINRETESV